MSPSRRLLLVSLGTLLLSGCANQLPQRSEHEERVERRLIDHRLLIDIGQPAVLELPKRRVRILEQKSFEATAYEVSRRYDRYTPYQPWREIYEIPLGALAVVAGVGANLLNVVALGNLPDSATRGWFDYGFAGLNPALNTESNSRSQQNLALLDERLQETRTEYSKLPWAERPVQIQAGTRQHEMFTDRNGVLHLNLLDSPLADQDLGQIASLRLKVADPHDDSRAEALLLVGRDLRGKLGEAHRLIYEDLEGGDVAQWVERVRRLAELGLEDEASELELGLIELTRNDPQLQQELIQRLREEAGRSVTEPHSD